MRSWIFVFTAVLVSLASSGPSISKKGRKLNDQIGQNDLDDDSILGDDFFNFGDNNGDDPFDDFGAGFDDDDDEDTTETCRDGSSANCTKVDKDEPRFNDILLERLVTQVWSDFQEKLNNGSKIGNLTVDPLDIDELLPEPIALKQAGSVYSAKVNMSQIKLFGLSDISLEKAEVTRDENLTDLFVDIRLAFDSLEINGTYSMDGFMGWWILDSQGTQDFSIGMKNATFSIKVETDTKDLAATCGGEEGNAVITNIEFPLEYDDINFRFNKLGDFANTVVNGVGIYFLQTQETFLVNAVKKAVKDNVHSLIC